MFSPASWRRKVIGVKMTERTIISLVDELWKVKGQTVQT